MATQLEQIVIPILIQKSLEIQNLEQSQIVESKKDPKQFILESQPQFKLKKDMSENRIANIFSNFEEQNLYQKVNNENKVTKNIRKTYTVDCQRTSASKKCSSTQPSTEIPVEFDKCKQQITQINEQLLNSECHSILKENGSISKMENKQFQRFQSKVEANQPKGKISEQLLFELRSKKVVVNNDKKQGLQKSGKQNSREDFLHTKNSSKSQKKVGFSGRSQMNNDICDSQENIDKKCTVTSIKIDEKRATVTKRSFGDKKSRSCFRSYQGSMKIISQNNEYRMFKMPMSKGSRCNLMRKQVQITNKQIEQKEQWLYRRLEQIHHKNIMRVFNKQTISRDNKTYLLIDMEYYPYNLADYFQQNKKQDDEMELQRKVILFQVLKALHYLHSKNIYHRNISPFSIFINQRLEVVLSNLSFIKSPIKDKLSQKNYYQCNRFIRPPEIILEPMNPFEWGGDMWGFGCVAAFMIEEKMPFLEDSDADSMLQIIKILGRPSQSYLKKIQFKGNKKFIFPEMPRFSLEQYFNSEDEDCLQMLGGVFQYDTKLRKKPVDVMGSRYFDALRNYQTYCELQKKYNIPQIFNFEQNYIEQGQRAKIVPQWSRHCSQSEGF